MPRDDAPFRILRQPDIQQAGMVMRELVEAIREEFWQVSTTSIDSWGRGISPVLRGAYLAALGPSLRPSDQLRHGTISSLPMPPTAGRAQVKQRARKIPAALWPSLAVRLSPVDGAYPRILAPVLSSTVLLVGNPMDLDEVSTRLGSVTDGRTVSRLLQLFGAIRTPELAAALDETARDFLAKHRVRGEPLTWHPPLSLLGDLDLPGPDPSLIDVARLHELVRERANSVRHAAKVLGATVDAVRVILDEHPAPAASLTEAQIRATGQVRHAARQALTEKEFRRRYIDRHQSLCHIAKQTGFSRQTLTRLATEYGITLREGPQDYKRKGVIDRDWLFEQYVVRGRPCPT